MNRMNEKKLYGFSSSELREPYSKIDADRVIEKPSFIDKALEKYFWSAARKLNNYLADNIGIALTYKDLDIRKERLPYILTIKDGKIQIGKIQGLYNPKTGGLVIDWDIPPYEIPKVLGHELVHYAQDKLGGIKEMTRKYGKKARGYIEGAASNVADSLYGESNAYKGIKNWFKKKFGKYGARGAIQGVLPA